MVRDVYWSGYFFHNKEGATQGGILKNIFCGIVIFPLICELHVAHPHVNHPWYKGDGGAGGKFVAPQEHIQYLVSRGTLWSYLHEPTKIILVILVRNIHRVDAYLWVMGVRVVPRSRYHIGFISGPAAEKSCIT